MSEPVDVWVVPGAGARHSPARDAALSRILAHYGLVAGDLDRTCRRCGHPTHGKPRPVGSPGLDLSMAHAGPALAVAVGRQGVVGIDMETADRLRFDIRSAHGVFTAAESAALAAAEDRKALTLALWTRKEAVVKAVGLGLAAPLDQVGVLGPGRPAGDADVLELTVEGEAFAVATFRLAGGDIVSVAASAPWPGVRWRAPVARCASAVAASPAPAAS